MPVLSLVGYCSVILLEIWSMPFMWDFFLPCLLCLYSKVFFLSGVLHFSVFLSYVFNFFSCTLLIWSGHLMICLLLDSDCRLFFEFCSREMLFSVPFHFLVLNCLCHVCQPGASLRHLCSLSSFSLISLNCFFVSSLHPLNSSNFSVLAHLGKHFYRTSRF